MSSGSSSLDVSFSYAGECGLVADRALYASFGFETQPATCHKVLIGLQTRLPRGSGAASPWTGVLEWAPIYESIRREPGLSRAAPFPDGEPESETSSESDASTRRTERDGGSLYLDWYKNAGSRTYHLGDTPIRDAYIQTTFGTSASEAASGTGPRLRLGRQRNFLGFEDEERLWNDDAKFAPYGHYLSRNLYTGARLDLAGRAFWSALGLFSGNHPSKGYANYYDSDETGAVNANRKGNNTPTLALGIGWRGPLESTSNPWFLRAGYERNRTGSSFRPAVSDGKRLRDTLTLVGAYQWRFSRGPTRPHAGRAGAIELWGSWTEFRSGLAEDSSQAARFENEPFIREFTQRGWTIGVDFLKPSYALGVAFEVFDRYDWNIWCDGVFDLDASIRKECNADDAERHPDLMDAKQKSTILIGRYRLEEGIWIESAFHGLENPALFASEIAPEHGDRRFKLTVIIQS